MNDKQEKEKRVLEDIEKLRAFLADSGSVLSIKAIKVAPVPDTLDTRAQVLVAYDYSFEGAKAVFLPVM